MCKEKKTLQKSLNSLFFEKESLQKDLSKTNSEKKILEEKFEEMMDKSTPQNDQ